MKIEQRGGTLGHFHSYATGTRDASGVFVGEKGVDPLCPGNTWSENAPASAVIRQFEDSSAKFLGNLLQFNTVDAQPDPKASEPTSAVACVYSAYR